MENKTKKQVQVIVVWCDNNPTTFEKRIPLAWGGENLKRIGSNNPLTLVFIDGLDKLSPSYLAKLEYLGYKIKDAKSVYQPLASKYKYLDQFGSYEKHCFLRWLVLDKLYKNQDIIHYDADILFRWTPEQIAKIVKDKTFVLDRCPAFTCISNHKWLVQYKKELSEFVKNRMYGKDWQGTEFRQNIGSDQDLIEYLLDKNILPQDKLGREKSLFVENPLELIGKPIKDLAFYHMQTDYIHYLNLRYMLEPYGLAKFAPNPVESYRFVRRFIYLLGYLANRKYQSRLNIYKYFESELLGR